MNLYTEKCTILNINKQLRMLMNQNERSVMDKILLKEKEGQQLYGLGRTKFREFAASARAVIHIGRSVRYDKAAIDAALEVLKNDQK